MDESLKKKVEARIKKAKESNWQPENLRSRKPDSLRQIINTPEKAEWFNKQLEEAFRKDK